MWAAAPKLAADLLGFVGPLASMYIIEWLEDEEAPPSTGFYWAAALFMAPFLQTLCTNQYFKIAFNTGMHVRFVRGGHARTQVPRARLSMPHGGVPGVRARAGAVGAGRRRLPQVAAAQHRRQEPAHAGTSARHAHRPACVGKTHAKC